ncbi:hypothetical protein BS47DRAFT_1360205 [Hydnum rufescens UP504]|uniref:Glutaredoxin domain-containing protein n=1 Tax=Hydnum rufescens UP504 TaxID=1448309 RepID=A0A9P6DZ13_9AGAM|nr:hypothetical protein BS47DRAFT_1360205 [Hydnum rufescens UP504]
MAGKEIVENAIAENDIVVFSRSWCSFSKKAKAFINTHEIDGKVISDGKTVKVFELDQIPEGDNIHAYLLDKTQQRTVPNIFIRSQHIGGSDDLHALGRSGRLKGILAPQPSA